MQLRILAYIMVVMGCGCSGSAAPLPDPAQPGLSTHTFFIHTITVAADDGIHEDLRLEIYLPDGVESCPLVVFTHGFSAIPEAYKSYGERLASWGMVVVMPKLPASFVSPTPHRVLAEYLTAVMDWATGEANEPGGVLEGRVDATRIALSGHSMGGKLSLLVATTDPRVDAVFGIDPVDSGPPGGGEDVDWPSVTPERMGNITVPLALVGETVDSGTGGSLSCAPADQNFQQYYAFATSPVVELEILGADHVSFLDSCDELCSAFCAKGTDDPPVTLALTQKYLVAFLRQQLFGEEGYRAWLVGEEAQSDVDSGLVLMRAKNGY